MPLDAVTVEVVGRIRSRTVEVQRKPAPEGTIEEKQGAGDARRSIEMPLDAVTVEVGHIRSRTVEVRKEKDPRP